MTSNIVMVFLVRPAPDQDARLHHWIASGEPVGVSFVDTETICVSCGREQEHIVVRYCYSAPESDGATKSESTLAYDEKQNAFFLHFFTTATAPQGLTPLPV